MAVSTQDNWQTRLDENIAQRVHALWNRFVWLDVFGAVIAKWTPLAMLFLILLAVSGVALPATNEATQTALLGGVSAIVAAVLARLINEPVSRFFARPRPFEQETFEALVWHEPGHGFPSNHATGAFALAVGMGLVPGYREVLYVLAVLVCLARIYGGLHYLTDVVAGALHGALVALIVRQVVFHVFSVHA
ncbi:phosphatase PAP2 family protein [Alicyclobacillus sp. ALC3]|uniref:phosphatase PAP2 family protein n=1 Tax=Alicyclobacillus sp. ALC3 TaxID=2796143 RepID=UPI0023797780|nr:phosphatase PAP2 family protein [Alicyclobacillus sp. ALC3]WDL98026.1 phosphatase PAP2 family protein [Alicyclobacillus sp. ALC3]